MAIFPALHNKGRFAALFVCLLGRFTFSIWSSCGVTMAAFPYVRLKVNVQCSRKKKNNGNGENRWIDRVRYKTSA